MHQRHATLQIMTLAALACLVAALPNDAASDPPDPRPGATAPVREQNLDSDGFIKVHEQGVADVNITNDSIDVNLTNDVLEVNGTVSVDNFPPQVDVNVVGGAVEAMVAPATAAFSNVFILGAGNSTTMGFGPIDATTIHVATTADDEVFVTLSSPLGASFRFVDLDGGALHPGLFHSFTQPVPLDEVSITCHNESADCGVQITVIGD